MFENFFKNNKIEIALKTVDKDPNNIIKLNILADLYIEGNFINEAIKILEKILRLDEQYLPALDKLGRIYIRTKQFLKAYRTLKLLFELNPDDFRVKTLLFSLKDADCDIEAKVEILNGLVQIESNIELLEQFAQACLVCGQYTKSANLYETLVLKEEKIEYFLALVEIYYKLQKWAKTSQILEKLMLTEHFNITHSEILADVYKQEKRFEEAIGIYKFLIENNITKQELYKEQIAKIHLLEKNPDKAIETTKSIVETNEYSVEAKFLTIEAFLSKKEYKEAIEYLREFYFDPINKETENKIIDKIVEISVLYSQKLRDEKQYTEAIDALIPALRYDEKNRNIYLELARISTEIRDYSSAKEYMKIAEEL